MKNMKTTIKAAAFALVIATAGAFAAHAACPGVYEYTRSDGVKRVCALRADDSFNNYCLYRCWDATM
jgi:hypothetical protein